MTGRAVRVWLASGATDAAIAAKNIRIVLMVLIKFLPLHSGFLQITTKLDVGQPLKAVSLGLRACA